MTIDMHDYSLSIIFLVSVVFILAATAAGRLLGARAVGPGWGRRVNAGGRNPWSAG